MTEPDETLLERARNGDRAAFGALVQAHYPRVRRLALHLTRSQGEADDVAQETFVRAWRAIERFDGRAELYTWLYRICVNVSLNLKRSRRREELTGDDPRLEKPSESSPAADPATMAMQSQAYATLSSALNALSESLRVTLVMACVESVPYAEIAQTLGCSEGTVAWRVHEARRKLRDALGDEWLNTLNPTGDELKKGGASGR
ncbi:MAG: sigma-70 family RNA polymerase sigma factor [Deltaproteobacteria bacterium]|nr:sigma-70 family RNA polymerase sigma factor [Deltaproteobacteria bacterium]